MSVYVVGAGVMGLSTAVLLQEKEPRAKITLVAEKFSGDTTSDVAAGHWEPFYLPDPRADLTKKWAESTFHHLDYLFREDPLNNGVGRVSGYELNQVKEEIPYWADIVPDFRRVGRQELDRLGWSKYPDAFFFTSYYLECKRYLPVLLERFKSNGGYLEKRKLNNLDEISGKGDVIVNCSGLASYHLVNDKTCFPIRGQVFKVQAPFIKHFMFDHEDSYIFVNHDVVTVGGTKQEGDWNPNVDKNDSKKIWERATTLLPSLKHAKILGEYVGLRPGRPTVRLELENRTIGQKIVPVVHNYGHGGSGITLHYGCSTEAADLAQRAVHKKTTASKY